MVRTESTRMPDHVTPKGQGPDAGDAEQEGDDADGAVGDDGLVGEVLSPARTVEEDVHEGIEKTSGKQGRPASTCAS